MQWLLSFYRSTIGKKILMAVTGLLLVGFVVSHMLANLLVFQGPGKLDEYAAFLRGTGGALWVARGGLLAAAVLHVVLALQLTRLNQVSRPARYARRVPQVSTLGSRSMRWGGVLLLAFIVYHLLHFTFGPTHPSYPAFDHATVHANVLTAFTGRWGVVAFYVVAMGALGLHLSHGVWSMLQTVGVNHPNLNQGRRRLAQALAAVVALGFAAVPIAVGLGWVR